MKYFSVHPMDLESQEFLSASNDQIATWLLLHAFCSKQLNGGTITEADNLPDRFWMRHGINLDVVKAASPLWEWDGRNVTIGFYDLEGQELYQKKVQAGKSHGRGRKNSTANRTPNRTPNSTANSTANSTPDSTPHSTPDREENRGEENRGDDKKGEKKPSSSDDRVYSPEANQLAILFKNSLPEDLDVNKKWKTEWPKIFDTLITKKNKPSEEIDKIIRWTRNSGFWSPKLINPTKLIKKIDGVMFYDRLKLEMGSDKSNPARNQPSAVNMGNRKSNSTDI